MKRRNNNKVSELTTISLETEKLTKTLTKIPGLGRQLPKLFVKYLSEFDQRKEENNIPGLTLEMVRLMLSDFAKYCASYKKNSDPDLKVLKWAKNNQWLGKNDIMTSKAFIIHIELISKGYDPESDTYYAEIDRRLKNEFF